MATSPWAFCTSGSAIVDAGSNVNTVIKASGSALENWSNRVESIISDIAGVDIVANFGDLTTNGKQILNDLASSMIAQKMVTFDTTAYSSQREAETILDVLENTINDNRKMLETKFVKTYMKVN